MFCMDILHFKNTTIWAWSDKYEGSKISIFFSRVYKVHTGQYIVNSTRVTGFKTSHISQWIREDRIICCQIFCDLLLKSAFERIFNVMQLILVKIKWHIKWKYLIQKFHDICLSYYFKWNQKTLWQYHWYKI
jgi:hypothetical protein